MTDVEVVESWGFWDLMSPICSLKLQGSHGSGVGVWVRYFLKHTTWLREPVFAHSQAVGAK